ncbi:hypothetical protein ACFUGD_02045 [Streptomyces sp. NPDC057217]|uniref:hypothetical protein n=1 Tax=Streptomyces sp. NPDC057217 TaxID=3346054 RepID=UPI00364059FE
MPSFVGGLLEDPFKGGSNSFRWLVEVDAQYERAPGVSHRDGRFAVQVDGFDVHSHSRYLSHPTPNLRALRHAYAVRTFELHEVGSLYAHTHTFGVTRFGERETFPKSRRCVRT